jgi:hypothetical protein
MHNINVKITINTLEIGRETYYKQLLIKCITVQAGNVEIF